MKKKRAAKGPARNAIFRVLSFRIPHAGKLGCLLLALIPFGCCLLVFFPLVSQDSHIMAVRKDAQGNVVEQIVLRRKFWTTARALPGPHGSYAPKTFLWRKYYLEEPGKPPRELTFLRDEEGPWACHPVENSSLWLIAGHDYQLQGQRKLRVIVFEGTEIIHQRWLDYAVQGGSRIMWFENGNRTLVYPTGQGFEAYDVITDTVAPSNPPKN